MSATCQHNDDMLQKCAYYQCKPFPMNTLYFKCTLQKNVLILHCPLYLSPIGSLLRSFWGYETTAFIAAFNHSKIIKCSHCSFIWITWASPATSLHVCHPSRDMNPRWLNPKKQSRTIQSLICMKMWRTSLFHIAPKWLELVWWKGISLWLQSL